MADPPLDQFFLTPQGIPVVKHKLCQLLRVKNGANLVLCTEVVQNRGVLAEQIGNIEHALSHFYNFQVFVHRRFAQFGIGSFFA